MSLVPSCRRLWFWALFAVAACFLHFKNLGENALWQDEAETAMLARNTARFGIPLAYDGVNLVSQYQGKDHDGKFVSNLIPWLSFYVTATSFTLFGESTFLARFPFAALGILNLVLLWHLAGRWSTRRATPALALWLGLLSVTHLLFARQARYYMLSEFFALVLTLGYDRLLQKEKDTGPLLSAGVVGLFYSSWFVFLVIAAPVALHFALFVRELKRLNPLVPWLGGAALLLAPGIWFFDPIGRALGEAEILGPPRLEHWKALARDLDQHVLPLGLLPFGAWLMRRSLGRLTVPISLFTLQVLVLAAMPRYFSRYSLFFVPLAAFLTAELVVRVGERNKVWAVIFGAGLLCTRLFSGSAWNGTVGLIKTDLGEFLGEITHEFPEPIKEASAILNRLAAPGDLLLISYPDLPFMFYTPLKVVGGLQGARRIAAGEVQWILLRDEREKKNWPLDYSKFEPIPLSGPDWPWGNRPDLSEHAFAPGRTGSRPVLYKRK